MQSIVMRDLIGHKDDIRDADKLTCSWTSSW